MNFISYAQNLEDVMLYRALKQVKSGFYIDVGAYHPVTCSVTKAFYDRGWNGINIEPLPDCFKLLQQERIRDINLNLAVAAHSGTLVLYVVPDEEGLSTSDNGYATRYAGDGRRVFLQTVPCCTLDDICSKYGVGTIHFMKVDVEGAEKEVLEGFALLDNRPWIILVEANEPYSTHDVSQKWESLLLNKGYKWVYYDGLNRFYLADEHSDLRESFNTHPNLFDEYITYPHYIAQQELIRVQQELAVEQAKWQSVEAQLRQELAVEQAKRQSVEAQLRQELAVEQAKRQSVEAQLRQELAVEQAKWQSVEAQLRQELAVEQAKWQSVEAQLRQELAVEQAKRQSVEAQLRQELAVEQAKRQSVEAQLRQELAVEQAKWQSVEAQLRQELAVEQAKRQSVEAQLRQELAVEQAKRQSVEAQLQSVYHSHSWQWTEPIRKGRRKLNSISGSIRKVLLRTIDMVLKFPLRYRWFRRFIKDLLKILLRYRWMRRFGSWLLTRFPDIKARIRSSVRSTSQEVTTNPMQVSKGTNRDLSEPARAIYDNLKDLYGNRNYRVDGTLGDFKNETK